MKMREAPWSAAAELPPWNPNQKAVAGATALQGAVGTTIFKAAKHLHLSSWKQTTADSSAQKVGLRMTRIGDFFTASQPFRKSGRQSRSERWCEPVRGIAQRPALNH
jgi:hypothetical protein